MPATSRSQQRLFGMVHARQKGTFHGHPSAKVRDLSRRVDPEAVTHFAETKHKRLPEKRAAHLLKRERAVTLARDALTVMAAAHPAFAKAASDLTRHADLAHALKQAFPAHSPQARSRLFDLVVKAADNLGAKHANATMGYGQDTTPELVSAVPTTSPQTFTGSPSDASGFMQGM